MGGFETRPYKNPIPYFSFYILHSIFYIRFCFAFIGFYQLLSAVQIIRPRLKSWAAFDLLFPKPKA